MDQYNALHIRQSPNLRKAIADTLENDTVLFGCCVGIPSTEVCKIIAAATIDWAVFDAEHTPFSPTLLADMVRTHLCIKLIPLIFTVASHLENVLPRTHTAHCSRPFTRARLGGLGA